MAPTKISKFACSLLALLVVSNSAVDLLGTYSRAGKKQEDLYSLQHLIIITELFKLILAAILEERHSYRGLKVSLKSYVLRNPRDALKMAIPVGLFLVQNGLFYVALSNNLSVATYTVISHSKILILAALSVALLGRSYSSVQWLCLVAVASGVCIIVLGSRGVFNFARVGILPALIGVSAGQLSMVYFEKLVKASRNNHWEKEDEEAAVDDKERHALVDNTNESNKETTNPSDGLPPASLWMRAMQWSLFSLLIAIGRAVYGSGEGKTFFHGFNAWVWIFILVNSFLGILIIAVIKYADNVLRALAVAASVILSTTFGHSLYSAPLNSMMVFGMFVVAGSLLGFCTHTDMEIFTSPTTVKCMGFTCQCQLCGNEQPGRGVRG